jgi:hypothetical protein
MRIDSSLRSDHILAHATVVGQGLRERFGSPCSALMEWLPPPS